MTWPSSAQKIFGDLGVLISAGEFPTEQLARLSMPCLILNDGGGSCDNQNPLLFDQQVEAVLFVQNLGDVYGTGALIGGNRADFVSNAGAGLHQVETELLQTFGTRGRVGGIECRLATKTAARPIKIQGNQPLLYRGFAWSAQIGYYDRYYLPATTNLTATAGVNLSWTLPLGNTGKFDFLNTRIVRKQNSAPTSETDGTIIYQGTGTSTTDAPGAGTWHYSAYVEYDEDEDGIVDHFSSADTDSIIV